MDDDIGWLEGLAAMVGLAGMALIIFGSVFLVAPIVGAYWSRVDNPPLALLTLGLGMFIAAILIDKLDGYRKKQTEKPE